MYTQIEIIIGVIAVLAGIALNIYVDRKRFYRRGPGGLQEFSSYRKSVFYTILERYLKLLGKILIIIGLFFILVGYYNQSEKKNKNNDIERPAIFSVFYILSGCVPKGLLFNPFCGHKL